MDFAEQEAKLEEELLVGYMEGSIFGGLMTFFGAAIMLWYGYDGVMAIYHQKETEFGSKINVFDEMKRPDTNITLGNFENSLHFIFGLANFDGDWDILNNPYIKYSGLEMNN